MKTRRWIWKTQKLSRWTLNFKFSITHIKCVYNIKNERLRSLKIQTVLHVVPLLLSAWCTVYSLLKIKHFPAIYKKEYQDSERAFEVQFVCNLSLCCWDSQLCSAAQPNENESKSLRRDDHWFNHIINCSHFRAKVANP